MSRTATRQELSRAGYGLSELFGEYVTKRGTASAPYEGGAVQISQKRASLNELYVKLSPNLAAGSYYVLVYDIPPSAPTPSPANTPVVSVSPPCAPDALHFWEPPVQEEHYIELQPNQYVILKRGREFKNGIFVQVTDAAFTVIAGTDVAHYSASFAYYKQANNL